MSCEQGEQLKEKLESADGNEMLPQERTGLKTYEHHRGSQGRHVETQEDEGISPRPASVPGRDLCVCASVYVRRGVGYRAQREIRNEQQSRRRFASTGSPKGSGGEMETGTTTSPPSCSNPFIPPSLLRKPHSKHCSAHILPHPPLSPHGARGDSVHTAAPQIMYSNSQNSHRVYCIF